MDKTAKPEAPATSQEDDFSAAFAEAIGEGAPVATEPAATTTPAGGDTTTEGATAPDAAGGDTPAGAEDGGEAGTVAPASPPVAAVEETAEQKIARLEAENAGLRETKPAKEAAAAPEAQPAAQQTAQEPAKPAEPEWYKLTEEEANQLREYETNWGDISAAETIRTKQAVYNAVQYVFTKIAEKYNPVLQRFEQMSDIISEQLTLSALRGEHNDYDDIHDKVVAWVDTLPIAFKRGAQAVLDTGTPEEVSELIATYKKDHPQAAAATTPAAAPRTTELSEPAKKAAKALTVVGSKRTTPVAPADANDFDSAWKEALAG